MLQYSASNLGNQAIMDQSVTFRERVYKVHNEKSTMYKYIFIRKSKTKTDEIVKTCFAAWHSTENEVVPCSLSTKIKNLVKAKP